MLIRKLIAPLTVESLTDYADLDQSSGRTFNFLEYVTHCTETESSQFPFGDYCVDRNKYMIYTGFITT